MGWIYLLLLVCSCTELQASKLILVEDNVVFHKVNDITTSRSKWVLSFLINLAPFKDFLGELGKHVQSGLNSAEGMVLKENQTNYQGFTINFRLIKRELEHLQSTFQHLIHSYESYETLQENSSGRSKRSLLPFVGQALSFLFGTVSDSDLRNIRDNIKRLAANQNRLVHVTEKGLSILNNTRQQVFENRQTINQLIETLHDYSIALGTLRTDIMKDLTRVKTLTQIYLQLDLIHEEIRGMITDGYAYLQHLGAQLNMLSLGHLAPSVISPKYLKQVLMEIKTFIPVTVKLPADPQKDLWYFYKILKCATVLDGDKLLVVVTVPLLDTNGQFDLFRVYNLPLPMENVTESGELSQAVIKYPLEAAALAINHERTQYAILTTTELMQCSHKEIKFCAVTSPVYPVNLSKLCLVSLFMKDSRRIEENCKAIVQPSFVLPVAQYVNNGVWVVTTNKLLRFTLVCENKSLESQDIIVTPPVKIVSLPAQCKATNDYLTLMPYYHDKSIAMTIDTYASLLTARNITAVRLWKPLHDKLPKFKNLTLPKELSTIDTIPIDQLIDKLHSFNSITEDEPWPNWYYVIVALSGSLIIGIGIYIYCRCRARKGKCRSCLTLNLRNFRSDTHDENQTEMVMVEQPGDKSNVHRPSASAPLLSTRREETLESTPRIQEVPNLIPKTVQDLYPTLEMVSAK